MAEVGAIPAKSEEISRSDASPDGPVVLVGHAVADVLDGGREFLLHLLEVFFGDESNLQLADVALNQADAGTDQTEAVVDGLLGLILAPLFGLAVILEVLVGGVHLVIRASAMDGCWQLRTDI